MRIFLPGQILYDALLFAKTSIVVIVVMWALAAPGT
jgi:hypothetical protein